MGRGQTSMHRARTGQLGLPPRIAVPEPLEHAVLHSTPSVAIFDVHCRPSDPGPSREECSSSDHIVFPRAGVFVRHVGGADVVADPNHVLFFGRHETHRVSHPAHCGDDCTVFAFSPSVLLDAVRPLRPEIDDRPDQLFASTHVVSDQVVFMLHERLRQACLSDAPDALALDEASVALLAALMQRAQPGRAVPQDVSGARKRSTAEAHRDQCDRAKLLLSMRVAEPLTLEDLARALHCSAFHLARMFRREVGLTIHQYRHRLRLRVGLERLMAGEDDLSALAQELGFCSHSHLSDAFRSAFGLAPSACRRTLDGKRLRELSKNLEVGSSAHP